MASQSGQIERLSAPAACAAGLGLAAVLACGVLFALTVVLNQSAVHWRGNIADSHLFAWHGWCVSQGARPYVDIWDNKPPGIWWLNAAGFWLCGEGMGGELLICAAALFTALVAFTAAAATAYHRSIIVPAALTGCVLLPHLSYEGGANRTETFVLACESVAMLAYLCWRRRGGWQWLLAAGLAAGAAPLFKQSGVAAAGAIALHLAGSVIASARGGRPGRPARGELRGSCAALAIFVAGCAVVPAIAAGVLAAQGALAEAWFAVVAFNRAYFEIGDATYLRIDRALWVFKDALLPLAGLYVVAAIGLVWGAVRQRGRRRVGPRAMARTTDGAAAERTALAEARTYVEVFWLWFVLATYLACVGPGRCGYHFMPTLAPLGLLALYPIHLLAAEAGIWKRMIAKPSVAVVTVAYLYVLALLACGSGAEMGRCWQDKSNWWALDYAVPSGWQQRAGEIRQLTRADERIYVWGWSPGTYRYAYRRAVSRFATFEKVGQLGERASFILESAKRQLRRDPPRVLVISPADLAGLARSPRDEFASWVIERYEDRGVVGGMHVMLAR